MPLRHGFSAAIAALVFLSASTIAMATTPPAPAGKSLTPQQQRMADCNKQATGKKGDERKTFMSSCLKGESTATATAVKTATPATQQEKMKACNAEAKTKALKGDARKAFMSTCLKGSPASP